MNGIDGRTTRSSRVARSHRRRPLVDRADEIRAAMAAYEHPELSDADRAWLRLRYAEIAEVVAVDALRAVESGEPLSASCLHRVRELGARQHGQEIPLGVALRAAVPALGVFAGLLPPTAPTALVVTWLQRGASVLQDLNGAWMEGWLQGTAPGPVLLDADAEDVEPQEHEILRLVADGRSNAEIAEATHYSRQAVVWRLSRLMRRWRAPNRAALVAAAFAKGVLVPQPLPQA
jgi:DNA-binding CsgD family transcriptional regulator